MVMATLVSVQSLGKSFGARPLFVDLSMGINQGEKMGLIGPNGAGKSTLMKLLVGEETPDRGEVVRRRDLRMVYLAQEDTFPEGETVGAVLDAAMGGDRLEDYERTAQKAIVMAKTGLQDESFRVDSLSGGWKKRLALARALARRPEMLMLDEPTNHLDLQGVLWLEELLRTADFAFVLISHDRYFLENVTNRIVELNRVYPEGYLSVEGRYSDYLMRKEAFLAAQAHEEHALEGKVKREIEWLRRGPQARTTKAEARIQQAHRMIGELADVKYRNDQQDRSVGIEFSSSDRRTRELLVAKQLSKSLGGRLLFRDLDLVLSPGRRIGLLGANGSGKTTLIRLLTGELEVDAGTVRRAPALRTVLFDQNRAALDRSISLRDALCPNGDNVEYRGRFIHVAGWARRFLFRSEELEMQVGGLSGGEQARILIANLMLKPADVLILDEPTNDLDLASMEVLEESLLDFPGAVVLVTHDRYMLDSVSTELLSLNGDGTVSWFADYAQWEASEKRSSEPEKRREAQSKPAKSAPGPGRRLSTAEMRELDCMEETILAAESEVEACQARLADPEVAADHLKMDAAWRAVQDAEARVARCFARWEELEARRKPAG